MGSAVVYIRIASTCIFSPSDNCLRKIHAAPPAKKLTDMAVSLSFPQAGYPAARTASTQSFSVMHVANEDELGIAGRRTGRRAEDGAETGLEYRFGAEGIGGSGGRDDGPGGSRLYPVPSQ